MYKLLLTISFFISTRTFAQQTDQRLLVKYTQTEIDALQKNDPKQYQFLINALDKGLFISDIPEQKRKDLIFDGELEINPGEKHTFLSIHKEITDKYQYYTIKGTNKMLVILPALFLQSK
jgi:hypothetical protein